MIDDADLLRRYVEEESEPAFAELVRRRLDLVYSAALRRLAGDGHAASEVAQQVFALLARQAPSLTRCSTLPGWLYSTTRNVAVDFIRAEQRRRKREKGVHTMLDALSPAESIEWEQLHPLLDEVMDELSDSDREAVLLRFFARRSFSEIGEAFKLSQDAARLRVDRAPSKLHALLARRGVTSSGAALAVVLTNQAVAHVPVGLAANVTGFALSSVGSVAAPVVSVFQVMSTTKLTAVLSAIVVVVAIGTATHESSERNRAEASLVGATRDYAAKVAAMQTLEQRAVAAEQDAVLFKNKLERERATREAATSAGAKPRDQGELTPDPVAEGRAFLSRHPETKAMLVAWRKAEINAKYGSLYRQLGLSPEQVAQFQALLLTDQIMTRSLGARHESIALFAGDGPIPDKFEQLRSLLGEEGFRQMTAIDETSPARETVKGLAAAQCFTDDSLTAEQASQLTQLINASQVKGTGRRSGPINWNNVMTSAPSFLSSPQIAALHMRLTNQAPQVRLIGNESSK